MNASLSTTLRTILLSVLLGSASGVFAAAIVTNALERYAEQVGGLSIPPALSETRPRPFPETYADAVQRVRDSALPTAVSFFGPGPLSVAPDRYIKNVRSAGVALTSDGWLMTAAIHPDDLKTETAVVRGMPYPVKQVVSDATTGVAFVKIDAVNLPVAAFGSGFEIAPGDLAFVLGAGDRVGSTSFMQVFHPTSASSDAPSRRLLLSAPMVAEDAGSPVVNTRGELIGLVLSPGSNASVLPLESVLGAFRSLLRSGNIARPTLGLVAVDLSSAIGLPSATTRGRTAGALVQTVVKAGAASRAGLRAGDIILSVDGSSLNRDRTLDEYLLDYAPGQTVRFAVDREGKQEEVEGTLE